MLNRNESFPGEIRSQVPRRADMGIVAWVVVGATSLMLAFGAMAQSQEEPPEIPSGVPEHYPALRIYAEGEILEVLDGGRVLRILAPAQDGHLFGDGRSDPRDPFGSGGVRSLTNMPRRGEVVVSLRNAHGWLFIDDPDGGAQERVRLDYGRDVFAPGQFIEIGPAPGLPSEAADASIHSQTTIFGLTTSVRIVLSVSVNGWVYIRLNRFKEVGQ